MISQEDEHGRASLPIGTAETNEIESAHLVLRPFRTPSDLRKL